MLNYFLLFSLAIFVRGKMEAYRFPHFGASVYVAMFNNVRNAYSLRARLVAASTMTGEEGKMERAAVNFAFIDAQLVCLRLHSVPCPEMWKFR